MSSDHIQTERQYYLARKSSAASSGRTWVQRDFEFWQRCTIEQRCGTQVIVSLDNLDELTVFNTKVSQFDLEPGELVFIQIQDNAISGNPAFVVTVKGESAEVEFPASFYGETERRWCLLRELRVYGGLPLIKWQKGTHVYAYQAKEFYPPMHLLFPAIVQTVHCDICVEVEFGDGETAYVPTTLVEKLDFKPGDIVYTCTSYTCHETNSEEQWSPCRVIRREGDSLLLRDEIGEQFEAPTSMVAVLPAGYCMNDGRFEKISLDSASALVRSIAVPESQNVVHIARTDDWQNAAENPITKAHVDSLIALDAELAWSTFDSANRNDDSGSVAENIAILWHGQTYFWWNGNEIRCISPNKKQLAKIIDIAVELDANVIGDDGEEIH